jgi:hypothetical protein
MKKAGKRIALSSLIICSATCAEGQADKPITGAVSPAGTYRVSQSGDDSVVVIERKSGRKVATLEDANDERSNVDFECSWSPDGARLAVVMGYGTRGSSFTVYERDKSGAFRPVAWNKPNPRSYYKNIPDDAAEMYSIRKWLNGKTLSAVIGMYDISDVQNYFLDCQLVIERGVVKNQKITRLGTLNAAQTASLLKTLMN